MPMHIVAPSATFTRPADITAYASGDLIANDTTASNVTRMSFTLDRGFAPIGCKVVGFEVAKSSNVTANTDFRLHLWGADPGAQGQGDNAAWTPTGRSTYLGFLTTANANSRAFSDGSVAFGVPSSTAIGNFVPGVFLSGAATLFGLLEARAAYVPTSGEVFVVTLFVEAYNT